MSMMWLAKVLAVLTATLAGCTPINERRTNPLHTNDNSTLVTGIAWRDAAGHVPVRREIRDLKDHFPEQWNLYILGLRAFQATEQSDPTSYYEIAGIHGRPYKPWGGVESAPGKSRSGYCPHGNTLFLGWHRPYIALYEQELYQHVQAAAMSYPPHLLESYTEAANSFRAPYWDWGLGDEGGAVPDVLVAPTVVITGADGAQQEVPNPLHHYEFHPLIPGDFEGSWAGRNSTIRWATTDGVDAQSRNGMFIDNHASQRRSLMDSLALGFGAASSFNTFSKSHLEEVHGNIHYAIGGSDEKAKSLYAGHMWPVDYSAFDPLFMLHHCNVDRLFALFQALYPDLWIMPATINSGTFSLPDDIIVDGDTELKPFWNSPTNFWTTNAVRNTTVFGYAYPETQSWNYPTPEAFQAAVKSSVAQLYSPSSRARFIANAGGKGGEMHHLLTGKTFTDWKMHISASLANLPSTFIARFSLVGNSSSDSVIDVGTWSILMPASHDDERQKRIRRASTQEPRRNGTVSLTAALLDAIAAGNLENLNAHAVVPYLKHALTWYGVGSDGTTIPRTDLHALTIQVYSREVTIPDRDTAPLIYNGEEVLHEEVTRDKNGV